MKKLGIIGGVGPMASAVFIEKIIKNTDAAIDQEHIPMVIEMCPYIPDRTAYILDNSKPNPVHDIVEAGRRLFKSGATKIAIPCVTSMAFCDEIATGVGLPVYNMVELTAQALAGLGVSKVGIMATDGTLSSRIFERVLDGYDIELVPPGPEYQRITTSLIYDYIKAGQVPPKALFMDVKEHFFEREVTSIILGCTEFSVMAHRSLDDSEKEGTLDVLDILSEKCVEEFGKLKA